MPAKSEKQRKFFGLVKSIKEGKTPASKSRKASKVAKSISSEAASDFARRRRRRMMS